MAKAKPDPVQADNGLEQHQRTAPTLKTMLEAHMKHGHAEQSIREDLYKGHRIAIKTTYEVTVDGKPFHASLGVSNAGNVQYHGIPNVGFASAIDLMRCVIDQFPDEFPKVKGGSAPPPHDHSTHDHGSMRLSARAPAAKKTPVKKNPAKKAGK